VKNSFRRPTLPPPKPSPKPSSPVFTGAPSLPPLQRVDLPERLLRHLLTRIREREISVTDLTGLAAWLDSNPIVPADRWYKRFPGMIVCGEGQLIKTFLKPTQIPVGQEQSN
jgi:hypothetical protein